MESVENMATLYTQEGQIFKCWLYEHHGKVYLEVHANNGFAKLDIIGESWPLSERLKNRIPWSALKDSIEYVAMDCEGRWVACEKKPMLDGGFWWVQEPFQEYSLEMIDMPEVDKRKFNQTLIKRPDVTPEEFGFDC